jgi:uncharacterized SAM-binding protein YcdF (DUF218 family)
LSERHAGRSAGVASLARRLWRLCLVALAVGAATVLAVVAAAAWMQHRHGEGRSLDQPVDAAIVLGAGIDPDLRAAYSSRRRVAAGVALLRDGKARHLILSGGTSTGEGPSAAELMRDYALEIGAPADAMLVEGRSRTTLQNLLFSFPLAERHGFERLALVTDNTHLLRADLLAAYFGRRGIGLVAASGLEREGWEDIAQTIGREALAWWYNLGKVGMWSLLGALGVPASERAEIVQ